MVMVHAWLGFKAILHCTYDSSFQDFAWRQYTVSLGVALVFLGRGIYSISNPATTVYDPNPLQYHF